MRALDVPPVDALDAGGCARQAADPNVLQLPLSQQAVAERIADGSNRLAAAAALGGLSRYAAALDELAAWIRQDFLLPPTPGRIA